MEKKVEKKNNSVQTSVRELDPFLFDERENL